MSEFIESQSRLAFTYPSVGATRNGEHPSGFLVDHNRVHLGSGQATFDAAKRALCDWQRYRFINMDFPAMPAKEAEPPAGLFDALDITPSFVGRSKFDKLVLVDSEKTVRALKPDFGKLRQICMRGVIVTSTSDDPQFDFVSRYFAPAAGIDEDPVTGSAHCCLAPFWSEQLGKTEMTAFQASARGGMVRVRVADERVILGGQAITVLKGELNPNGGDAGSE